MTELITRCPKCHTSFRVNEDHLKTARGAVRCGSCLNIFNAKEHLLKPQALAEESKKTSNHAAVASKNSKQDEEDILISDDMPIDDEDLQPKQSQGEDLLESNVFIAKTASKSEINLFERRIKDAEEHDKDNTQADESWALSLLEDDNSEEPSTNSSFSITEKEEQEPDETEIEEEPFEEPDEQDEFTSMFQVLEEDNHEEQGLEPFPDESLEADDYEAEAGYETQNYASDFSDTSNTDFLESFEPDPLELHVKDKISLWNSSWLWLSLSLIAGLALVAQIAYFKFEDWGRQQPFRPYYAQLCQFLDCSLPVLQDLQQIKVDNMVVINHPQTPGMLLVDATIQNRANFDQYFPSLLLTFTDINNTLVSKLLFKPEDYVGGELAGKRLMPAKHPIHITLEITDPGEDALNYQISVVKP